MTNFEEQLGRLVHEWEGRTSTEDLISALELEIYRLKEEAANED